MLALGTFLLLTLSAARLTRVIVNDDIGLPIRRFMVKHNGTQGFWTRLVHCPFCTSVWVSAPAGVYWVLLAHVSWWLLLPAIGAMSYLVAPVLLRLDTES
jgi:hypothetical protein